MEVGAPRRRAALPFVGVDAGAVVVTPLEGVAFPSDEEAQAQGYQDTKDWYGRAVAPSLLGTPALDVELKTLKDGATLDEEEERVSRMEDHAHAASSLASVPGFPPDSVGLRPFLLADAGPDMRQRFDRFCVLRAQLAKDAEKSWLKEFREPVEPGHGRHCLTASIAEPRLATPSYATHLWQLLLSSCEPC